jgi:hypothetical protein
VRPPRDQGLFLTVFIGICVAVVLGMWLALPAHIKVVIEGEDMEEESAGPEPLTLKPAVTPEERIEQMERALSLAQAAIKDLEQSESEKAGSEKAGSNKVGTEKAGSKKKGSSP